MERGKGVAGDLHTCRDIQEHLDRGLRVENSIYAGVTNTSN